MGGRERKREMKRERKGGGEVESKSVIQLVKKNEWDRLSLFYCLHIWVVSMSLFSGTCIVNLNLVIWLIALINVRIFK